MHFGQEEIDQLTQTIWGTVLGWDVERIREPDRNDGDEPFPTGRVRITGAWEGTVQLACAPALARQAAATMFGMDAPEVTPELIRDALGELTNMTGGNFKALLPEPCCLGLPDVAEDSGPLGTSEGRVMVRASYRTQGRPFVIAVLERTCHQDGGE